MTIEKFASDTSLHGVKHIFVQDTLQQKGRQIFWTSLFFVLFGTCIALLGITINSYFQYGSVTSATHEMTDSIDFPSVTFCNLQIFKRESGLDIVNEYERLKANLSSELYTNETVKDFYTSSLKSIGTEEFYMRVSLTLNETAVFCSIGASGNVPCKSYFTYLFTEFGPCFTFHSREYIKENGIIQTTKAGPTYGFMVTLDAKKDSLQSVFTTTGSGFRILIHDPDVYPLMTEKSFLVALGMETFITIKKHIFQKLSKPYSKNECFTNTHATSSPGDEPPYSQELCLYKCLMNKTFKGTCTMLKYDKSKPQCSVYHAFEYALSNFASKDQLLSRCNLCLPTCQNTRYFHSLSTVTFTDDNLASSASVLNWPTRNLTYIKENYAHVKIFYNCLEYSKTVQSPTTTFERVLSDIGGLLGIFLGASIMTLAEVVEYLISHVTKRINRTPVKKIKVMAFNYNKENLGK